MASKPLIPPKHITRPNLGREITAWHNVFDISAWKLATGREVLCLKGKVINSDTPRDDVFGLKHATLQQIVACYKMFYDVDLQAK